MGELQQTAVLKFTTCANKQGERIHTTSPTYGASALGVVRAIPAKAVGDNRGLWIRKKNKETNKDSTYNASRFVE
jgi:hypothetical protein